MLSIIHVITNINNIFANKKASMFVYYDLATEDKNVPSSRLFQCFDLYISDQSLYEIEKIQTTNENIKIESFLVSQDEPELIGSIPIKDMHIEIEEPDSPDSNDRKLCFLLKKGVSYEALDRDIIRSADSEKYVFFRFTGLPVKNPNQTPTNADAERVYFIFYKSSTYQLKREAAAHFKLPEDDISTSIATESATTSPDPEKPKEVPDEEQTFWDKYKQHIVIPICCMGFGIIGGLYYIHS